MKTVRRPPYPKWNPGYFPCSSLTPLPLSSRRPSVSFGGFGLKTTVNTDVLAAYGELFTWGTDNKAELVQLWTDVGAEAKGLSVDVGGATGSVLAAYKSVLNWSTTNKPTFTKFWDDIRAKVRDLVETIASVPDSIEMPKVVLPQPSLPRLPGLPFAKDEPMLPASADTETVIKEIDEALGQVEERLDNINDDWLNMAALVITIGGLLLARIHRRTPMDGVRKAEGR